MKMTIDGQAFDYDPTRLMNTEAMALQKVTGMSVPEWSKALQSGDAYAMTGLVWLLWRRNGREVAFDEVEFDLGSVVVEDDEPAPVEAAPAKGTAKRAATPTVAEPATAT